MRVGGSQPSTSEMLPWQPLLAGWVQGSLPPPQLVQATMSLGPAAAQPAGDASSTPPAPLFLAASVPCAHTQNQRPPFNLCALFRFFNIILPSSYAKKARVFLEKLFLKFCDILALKREP